MTHETPLRRPRRAKTVSVLLWTGQALLAVLFLFAAAAKLTMPAAALAESGLPVPFLRFLAIAELAGALGLVLPGLLRVRRGLTPLAAVGLAIIMIGATAVTAVTRGAAPALFPFAVGAALILVARGRRGWLQEIRPNIGPRPVAHGTARGAVRAR